MAVHRKFDVLPLVAILVCVVGYASFRSEYRLRTTMPSEFFDASGISADKRAAEETIARAYWKCAVTQVQWRYGYARRLPDDPPDEFAVTADEAGAGASDVAVRARYWQRIREVWNVSAVWHEEYEWSPVVFRESLQSAGDWLGRVMHRYGVLTAVPV